MDDHDPRAKRPFALDEAEKERRLAAVKARLTIDTPPPPRNAGRSAGGWFLPALFWTALIVLGTVATSHWLGGRGDTTPSVRADGSLSLRLGPGGRYEVAGSVAGQPTRFIVDTGASLTSIPKALGDRIGIRECPAIGFDLSRADEPGCCRRETFHTANGSTEGCVARVPLLRFGPFEVQHAQVAVMPAIGDRALLGMNVLKHFSLLHAGAELSIRPTQRP